ncbi:Phosphatidyl-N-methylethanolamine N-methyltransferase [Didymosphaeria variabile]|uniref:Phosphatidyl-N-methylethanolamine N-methyltransferase n=1 Tax=Didymosphaeria variabile TaxID=1932322 RepID=A0A9W9CC82_9PLEO|nr:Phosphatidyl-N-methylethanolamine N-methyltransferase [Didymosphaeria variabile]KAJ4354504.1 Phosphatidyl-N-methylethanolamine N-methyltransferase [Didymosphaeria variabile]
MSDYIDFSQPSLWKYYNKTITKLFGGNPRYGCYALAATIFSLGIVRDFLYVSPLPFTRTTASLLHANTSPQLRHRPLPPTHAPRPPHPLIHLAAIPLFLTGTTLVLSSMYALGVTGTYLGDYFGILMDAPVTSFPFNVSDAPMYHGSTLSFLATAIWKGKPAGIFLTVVVAVCYSVARRWEDPFTEMIYQKRDEERKKAGGKAQ